MIKNAEIFNFLVHHVISKVVVFYSCTNVRVANSHTYGVILTHLTCYSRTHAIDKITHALKKIRTHTHAI